MRLSRLLPVAFSLLSLPALAQVTAPEPLIEGDARVSRFIANASSSEDADQEARLPNVPTFTAIQFDSAGVATAQVSVYAGRGFALRQAELIEYLRGFSLSREQSETTKRAAEEFVDVLLLPRPSAPTTAAAFSVIDPSADLVIELRHVETNGPLAISCSASSILSWSANLSAGAYWVTFENGALYTTADMFMLAAGPKKGSSADPDLYLERWTGSSWVSYSSSLSYTLVDAVRGYSGSCTATRWRVKLHMYVGGQMSARAVRFNAS